MLALGSSYSNSISNYSICCALSVQVYLLLKKFLIPFICLGVLPVCLPVHVRVQYQLRPKEGPGFPETGVRDDCECWVSNPGPLEDQQVLF